MTTNDIKPIVFLAHNSQDKSQIRVIADKLKQKGIDTWLDEEQIPPGTSFQDHIQKAINEIDCAIIFIGKQGLGKWQGWELKAFFSKLVDSSIPLIPVLLPGVKQIPNDLPFLRELNWVQFADDLDDPNVINRLVWGITRKTNHVDYDRLKKLLVAGQWRPANNETRRIILQSVDREKEGYLDREQMRKFDSDVLLKLDRLWLLHSQNRFGFSVQKGILSECQQDANRFGKEVGWRSSDRWLDEASINYSLNAPTGHLPYGMLRIVEIDNAVIEGIVNTQFKITKAVATEKWQRQLIADFVAGVEFLTGNRNFNSGEFREGLDEQLAHNEPWWKGERAEEMKINNLCLLLFSCEKLEPHKQVKVQEKENNPDARKVPMNDVESINSEPLSMACITSSTNKTRLEKERELLQVEYDLRIEKLSVLRRSLAIEVNPSIKFMLEHQIQDEDKRLAELNSCLKEIELAMENK
jgi:hypothetical protein